MSLLLTFGSWTVDEPRHASLTPGETPALTPQVANVSEPPKDWVPLLHALLDAICPFREAYVAALAVVQQALHRLPP